MGDVVCIARPVARPEPQSFEDQRVADWHRPVEAAPAAGVPEDCICTVGTTCRHNNACPRPARRAGVALTLVGA